MRSNDLVIVLVTQLETHIGHHDIYFQIEAIIQVMTDGGQKKVR